MLVAQRRIDDALQRVPVTVLGDLMEPRDYLRELKSLSVLLLHLAAQPGGEELVSWAALARAYRQRSAGDKRARWGLAPPTNLQLRGQALATADEILRVTSLDEAADLLHPWTELTTATNDGQLGWLADHTTMSTLLTRMVMAATASRRRLATLLDRAPESIPVSAIPQVLPAAVYNQHVARLLDVTSPTGRLFGSLCLARHHPGTATWADAATTLGLPAELATKTARACSAHLLASPNEFIAALARLANSLDPFIDYRVREDDARRLARNCGWYRPWARIHLPGSHSTSQQYAVTWLWTQYAHGHIDTSPGWQQPPSRHDRAHYRAYVRRLGPVATDALIDLVDDSAPSKGRQHDHSYTGLGACGTATSSSASTSPTTTPWTPGMSTSPAAVASPTTRTP